MSTELLGFESVEERQGGLRVTCPLQTIAVDEMSPGVCAALP